MSSSNNYHLGEIAKKIGGLDKDFKEIPGAKVEISVKAREEMSKALSSVAALRRIGQQHFGTTTADTGGAATTTATGQAGPTTTP